VNVLFKQDDLEHLDELGCEALLLPLFSDERPPQGTLAWVDWRFAGMISRLIERGVIRGDVGCESMLPARRRLPSLDKIFVFGLGPSAGFDEPRFERAVEAMLALSRAVKLRTFGLALPGRSLGLVAPVRGVECFLRLAERQVADDAEITILDEPEALREMEPVVALVRRRIRARYSAP
jgi:hypothetical protein